MVNTGMCSNLIFRNK